MIKRLFFAALAASVPAQMASAQNLAPEFMIDGTCEELVAWASRPSEDIRADLDTMYGTSTEVQVNESTLKTIMGVLERTPVSDAWFARPCSFTDDQLKAMDPLHDAYLGHMKNKLSPK